MNKLKKTDLIHFIVHSDVDVRGQIENYTVSELLEMKNVDHLKPATIHDAVKFNFVKIGRGDIK